jgi:hypothetical protein
MEEPPVMEELPITQSVPTTEETLAMVEPGVMEVPPPITL